MVNYRSLLKIASLYSQYETCPTCKGRKNLVINGVTQQCSLCQGVGIISENVLDKVRRARNLKHFHGANNRRGEEIVDNTRAQYLEGIDINQIPIELLEQVSEMIDTEIKSASSKSLYFSVETSHRFPFRNILRKFLAGEVSEFALREVLNKSWFDLYKTQTENARADASRKGGATKVKKTKELSDLFTEKLPMGAMKKTEKFDPELRKRLLQGLINEEKTVVPPMRKELSIILSRYNRGEATQEQLLRELEKFENRAVN
jgi:hypothetical protein